MAVVSKMHIKCLLNRPQVKVLLGLGGWTDSTNGEKYSKLVLDKNLRKNFVDKTVKTLQVRGFDGLSLEWNFPVCWQSNCLAGRQEEKEGFVALVKVNILVNASFHSGKLLLLTQNVNYTSTLKNVMTFCIMTVTITKINNATFSIIIMSRMTQHYSKMMIKLSK